MAAQCVTKVELTVSCDHLLDRDIGSKSDPLCVLLMNTSESQWYEVSPGYEQLHGCGRSWLTAAVMRVSWIGSRLECEEPLQMYFPIGGAHGEGPELPQSQVCQEVCHRLLFRNGAEADIWDLWHRQQNRRPEWWRLPGAAGDHLGPGRARPGVGSNKVEILCSTQADHSGSCTWVLFSSYSDIFLHYAIHLHANVAIRRYFCLFLTLEEKFYFFPVKYFLKKCLLSFMMVVVRAIRTML